ncbi:MAG: histidine kinase [Chitinophagaceae bacterium]|nr:histidine kinase [Chitinophagaceae bacterium]
MTTQSLESSPARLRWREHELILATVICVLTVAGNIWKVLDNSWTSLNKEYGDPFYNNDVPFNYATNILLPNISVAILLYLSFLVMNFSILPRLLQTDAPVKGSFTFHFARSGSIEMKGDAGRVLKRTIGGIIYTLLLMVILGAGWGLAIFYRNRYVYSIPGNEMDPRQVIIAGGLKKAFWAILVYLLYASIREAAISKLTQSSQWKAFRVRLANQVSGYFVVYCAIIYYFFCFDIIDDKAYALFIWIPPAVFIYLTHIFWLFPFKGNRSIFKGPVFRRLLLSTLLWLIPFSIVFCLAVEESKIFMPTLLGAWLFALLLVTPLSWFIYRWRKDSILRFRGLEIALDKSEADLQFLRSQINPHFLFNSLNTLYGTALQENAFRAAEGIQKLGDMMRFMLHENHQEKIPMYKEIEYLKNYIDLQKLRTQSSPDILIESDIDGSGCDHMIAPMLLIPFVENAFKHGISLQERSWVNIRLHCDAKGILFEVRNSVHIRKDNDPEKDKSGVGMKNVVNRLRLIYPGKHDFFVNGNDKEFFIQLLIEPGKITTFEKTTA